MEIKGSKERRENGLKVWHMALIFGLIILVAIAYGGAVTSYSTLTKWEERGQFGDMFGALNAVMAGLAFGGLIIAIMLQKAELEAQREELSLTRQVFKEQTSIMKDQTLTMYRQNFQANFFQLLSLLSGAYGNSSLYGRPDLQDEPKRGSVAVRSTVSKLIQRLKSNDARTEDAVRQEVESFLDDKRINVWRFVDSVRAILHVVDAEERLDAKEKRLYVNLVFLQLELPARVLVYYVATLLPPEDLRALLRAYQFDLVVPVSSLAFSEHERFYMM